MDVHFVEFVEKRTSILILLENKSWETETNGNQSVKLSKLAE